MKRIIDMFLMQFNETYSFHKKEKLQKTLIRTFYRIVLFALAFLIMKSFLGFLMGFLGLVINKNFIVFLILGIQLFQIMFLLGYTTKSIFLSNDLPILLNMPVKTHEILFSKLLLIILREIHATVLYTIIIVLAASHIVSFSLLSVISLILFLIMLSILSSLLSVIFSIVILKVRIFFKGKLVLTYISSFVGFIIFSTFLAYIAFNIIDIIGFASNRVFMTIKLNQTIAYVGENIWLSRRYLDFIFLENTWFLSSLFIIGSGLSLLYIVYILGKHIYFDLVSNANLYFKRKQKKQISKMTSRNTLRAIIYKDILNIYREPGYMFQYLLLPIMMPFLIFLYNQLFQSIDTNQLGDQMIVGANVMLIILVSSISNVISSTGFSRAGKNAYLVKVVPVPYKTEVKSKIYMNLVISTMSILITYTIGIVSGMFELSFGLLTLIPILLINFAHIMWSYDLDISDPSLNWHNEEEMIVSKNISKSIMLGMFIAIFFGLFIMISLGSSTSVSTWIKFYVYAGILFYIRTTLLNLKYNHYINTLEM